MDFSELLLISTLLLLYGGLFGTMAFLAIRSEWRDLIGELNLPKQNETSHIRERVLRELDNNHTFHVTSFDGKSYFAKIAASREELASLSLVMRRDGLTIYEEQATGRRPILIAPYDSIRGVFESSQNGEEPKHVAIHFEDDDRWQVLWLPKETLQAKNFRLLLDMFETITHNPRYTLFKNRLYFHSEIYPAQRVSRQLSGDPYTTHAVCIYIMPLYIVITEPTGKLLQKIPTDGVKHLSRYVDAKHTKTWLTSITTDDGQLIEFASKSKKLASDILTAVAEIQNVEKKSLLVSAKKSRPQPDNQRANYNTGNQQ